MATKTGKNPNVRNHKKVTYWESYDQAFNKSEKLKVGYGDQIRIVPYTIGYAIQREISGPYWNNNTKTWN